MTDIRKTSLSAMAATIIGWDLGHDDTTIHWPVKPKEVSNPKKRAKVKAARNQKHGGKR